MKSRTIRNDNTSKRRIIAAIKRLLTKETLSTEHRDFWQKRLATIEAELKG